MFKLIFAIFFSTILPLLLANFLAKSSAIHSNDQSIQSNFPCTGYADFDCGLGELRVRCIPSLWLCDNVFDCSTGQDEAKCLYLHKCPPGTLICSNGDCILAQQRCDGKMQCLDGSDERGCLVGGIHPFPWGKKNFPHQSPSAGPYSSSAIFHRPSHQNSAQQIQQQHQNNGKNADSDAIEVAAHFDRWLSKILTLLLAFLIFGQILVLAIVLRRRKNQRQNRRSRLNAGNGNGGLRRTRVRFVAVGFKAAGISHPKKELTKEEQNEEDDICSISSE